MKIHANLVPCTAYRLLSTDFTSPKGMPVLGSVWDLALAWFSGVQIPGYWVSSLLVVVVL